MVNINKFSQLIVRKSRECKSLMCWGNAWKH